MNALILSPRLRRALVTLSLGVCALRPVCAETTAPPAPPLPAQELTREVLFSLLVGELALHYGDLSLANGAYAELLKRSKDPRIAQRALDIALASQQWPQAQQAAQQWAESDRSSAKAQEVYAGILIAAGKTDEARRALDAHLKAHPERAPQLFLQLDTWLDRLPNTQKTSHLELAESLTARFRQLPEAHYALAAAALNDNRADKGLAAIETALKSRPKWPEAALIKAGLLQLDDTGKAVAWLQTWQKRHGENPLVNNYLARLLLTNNKLAEARAVFDRQIRLAPRDSYAPYAAALIAREQKDFKSAIAYLNLAQERGYRDADAVTYHLGDSLAETGQTQAALDVLDSVESEEWSTKALARSSAIRAGNGQLDAALKRLERARAERDAPELWQIEADTYRQLGRIADAVQTLNKGLAAYPDDTGLLYLRAMMLDRQRQYADAEKDLRRILQQTPDDATTLNALGYMLADRGERLDEARELIEKAHRLKPNDAYILDSLGWVYVQLGRLEEGLNHLQNAYARQTDPEIAAHLVQNLWRLGRRDEAKRLLQGANQAHPGHEALKAVQEKLQAPSP